MKYLNGIGQTTDHLMFEGWSALLRPLFPAHAEFSFKLRRRVICVYWAEEIGAERAGRLLESVTIAFMQLAWKSYRGARSARRSRADERLAALVAAALAQHDAENSGDETDLQISVASVDLFPPTFAHSAAIAHCLPAA